MKYILSAITFFCISAASFGQATFDSAKIVRYTSYGSSYPRWVVRDVFIPPTLSDTPTIAAVNRKYWKGAFMLRMAVGDTSHYFHNGLKWARFTGVGGGSSGVTTFNSRAGAITPLFADYSAFYSALGHPHSTVDITSGQFGTGRLGSGTATASTILLGNGTWFDWTSTLSAKLNATDTSTMLANYRSALNTHTISLATKLNTSDTSNMLLAYRNAINSSVTLAQMLDSLSKMNITIGYGLKDSGTATNPTVVDTSVIASKSYVIAADALKISTTNYIVRETPSGTVNSSNTVFTLANTPVTGKEMVFLNGVLQDQGATNDYTISSSTITMITAPPTGSKIRVTYIK